MYSNAVQGSPPSEVKCKAAEISQAKFILYKDYSFGYSVQSTLGGLAAHARLIRRLALQNFLTNSGKI